MKIPKIIHVCWLSGEDYPNLVQKCIDSWKRTMPDYEIMLWTSENFDFNTSVFARQAYFKRKWAFAADFIRLWALYNYGGIYLDSDVYVFKSFDKLLDNQVFSAIENCIEESGFTVNIEAAVIGSIKGHPFIKDCLDYYQDREFINIDGSLAQTTLPKIVADIAKSKYGFKSIAKEQILKENICIYSNKIIAHAHIENFSIKTLYAIHLCEGGWYAKSDISKLKRFVSLMKRFIRRPIKTLNLIKWDIYLNKLIER